MFLRVGEGPELVVPVGLERIGDQAVGGIDMPIALARELGLVLGPVDLEAAQAIGLVEPCLDLLLDGEGDVEGQRGHGGDEGCPTAASMAAPSTLWQMGSASRWPRRWQ